LVEWGDNYPCALNAAGEIAVRAFLQEKIPFTGIAEVIEDVLNATSRKKAETYEDLREEDVRAREKAKARIENSF